MGIDASLTSTGVVVLDGDKIILSRAIVTKPGDYNKDILRLMAIRNEINSIICRKRPSKIYIEGFSFGSKGQAVYQIAMLGGLIREMLQCWEVSADGIAWQEIPPTVLKKFATGKGNSKKEIIRLEIFKRWQVELKTNDECDAWVLAKMAQG